MRVNNPNGLKTIMTRHNYFSHKINFLCYLTLSSIQTFALNMPTCIAGECTQLTYEDGLILSKNMATNLINALNDNVHTPDRKIVTAISRCTESYRAL